MLLRGAVDEESAASDVRAVLLEAKACARNNMRLLLVVGVPLALFSSFISAAIALLWTAEKQVDEIINRREEL
jgi:hypothetical protein